MQTLTPAEEAFIDPPETEVCGLKLRPFSVGSLVLMRKLGLQVNEGAGEEDQLRAMAGVAWIQSAPLAEVMRAVRDGSALEKIDEFAFSIGVNDVTAIAQEIARISGQVNAATVSIEPKPGDREELPPGN